jgi:hypothetical protein
LIRNTCKPSNFLTAPELFAALDAPKLSPMVGKMLFSSLKKGSCQQSSHRKKRLAHLPKPNNTIEVMGNKGYIRTA